MTLMARQPLSEQFETVNRFRRKAPVDVVGLTSALGVRLRNSFLPYDISGMIEREGRDGFAIAVNANDPKTRQRFTIAHELGHFMLHREMIGDGIADDRAYRSTDSGRYRNTQIGPREETEANAFAANVLMPYELIEELRKTRGLYSVEDLARELGVSRHAMSIRLGIPYELAAAPKEQNFPMFGIPVVQLDIDEEP